MEILGGLGQEDEISSALGVDLGHAGYATGADPRKALAAGLQLWGTGNSLKVVVLGRLLEKEVVVDRAPLWRGIRSDS